MTKEIKKVAVDYKDKYFTIMDENLVDDEWDEVIYHIDVGKVNLVEHVHACLHYGISSYYGKDKKFIKKIKEIEEQIL